MVGRRSFPGVADRRRNGKRVIREGLVDVVHSGPPYAHLFAPANNDTWCYAEATCSNWMAFLPARLVAYIRSSARVMAAMTVVGGTS